MAEQLLSVREVCARIGIGRTQFYRVRASLVALGLQAVRVGKHVKYRAASVDKVIVTAAERRKPISIG